MRPRALTPEQHKMVAERHYRYLCLRLEAAKHSIPTMARELGVDVKTIRDYLNRKIA